MVLGDLDSCMQKMKLDYQVTPYTKINSRWIKDFIISRDTINVLEENIGWKMWDVPQSNIVTNISPRSRDIKEKINKWDLIHIKSLCMAKEIITKMKREPTIWDNIFANDISDNSLISQINKELTWLHSMKINNPIKNRAKDMNRDFSKEDIQRAQRIWKDAQHH